MYDCVVRAVCMAPQALLLAAGHVSSLVDFVTHYACVNHMFANTLVVCTMIRIIMGLYDEIASLQS